VNKKFNLERRNLTQAGKLTLAIFYEAHGYEVNVLSGIERFDMRTPIINPGQSDFCLPEKFSDYYDFKIGSPIKRGVDKIVLWGVTSGMSEVPLENVESAGLAIRAFDSGKGGLNDFLGSSERQYTHFAILYENEKSVEISTLA
jgi:hypothetical protein